MSLLLALALALAPLCCATEDFTAGWFLCLTFILFCGSVRQRAVITSVSPDVLYLFRVQAVCQPDLRSDFSQTLLFRGTGSPRPVVTSASEMSPCQIKNSLFCFSQYNKNI